MKKVSFIFKATEILEDYLTASGKILGRSHTRLKSKDQRIVKKAIKTSRVLGMLGFSRR